MKLSEEELRESVQRVSAELRARVTQDICDARQTAEHIHALLSSPMSVSTASTLLFANMQAFLTFILARAKAAKARADEVNFSEGEIEALEKRVVDAKEISDEIAQLAAEVMRFHGGPDLPAVYVDAVVAHLQQMRGDRCKRSTTSA
jgi:hypothetical protein